MNIRSIATTALLLSLGNYASGMNRLPSIATGAHPCHTLRTRPLVLQRFNGSEIPRRMYTTQNQLPLKQIEKNEKKIWACMERTELELERDRILNIMHQACRQQIAQNFDSFSKEVPIQQEKPLSFHKTVFKKIQKVCGIASSDDIKILTDKLHKAHIELLDAHYKNRILLQHTMNILSIDQFIIKSKQQDYQKRGNGMNATTTNQQKEKLDNHE